MHIREGDMQLQVTTLEFKKYKKSIHKYPLAQLMGCAVAFPDQSYSQQEIAKIFGIKNKVVHKLMNSGHIKKRYLYLPPVDTETQVLPYESPVELHAKFHKGIRDIGVRATEAALKSAGISAQDVNHFIAVTSSGFAVPGVSSIVSKSLNMRQNLYRLDIVGMGCNAGMNALQTATNYIAQNPTKIAVILCCEINSASYVKDETIRTGIVNSLFGDGAVAIVLKGTNVNTSSKIKMEHGLYADSLMNILDFESYIIPEQSEAMRYDWNLEQNKWSFYLSKDIPFVVGQNMVHPVRSLLKRHKLDTNDIKHWVLHTGGGAVIKGAQESLGLNDYQVRHTTSVLRDYGNLSSGSFLVSLNRLYEEQTIQNGDLGVLIAMGPGANIEVCLVKW